MTPLTAPGVQPREVMRRSQSSPSTAGRGYGIRWCSTVRAPACPSVSSHDTVKDGTGPFSGSRVVDALPLRQGGRTPETQPRAFRTAVGPHPDVQGRRIVQALGNLLSNAAHHSNELSPIRVAAVRDGVHVAFSVADDGVGVPAERLPYLFRKFSRLDGEERGREIAGSGLGLAICKGIVEAHGGRIRAESDGLGLGSRVHLHRSGGGGDRHPPPSTVTPSQDEDQGAAPRPVRGRRPADAPVRAGRAHEGGLHARRDRRPGGGLPADGGGNAPPGPAGHDAAGQRRHGADEGHP